MNNSKNNSVVQREEKRCINMSILDALTCCLNDSINFEKKCNGCPYGYRDAYEVMADARVALSHHELNEVTPALIELDSNQKDWLNSMTVDEAFSNIANICIDWDGYRTRDGLGMLLNEIWAYANHHCVQYGENMKKECNYDHNIEKTADSTINIDLTCNSQPALDSINKIKDALMELNNELDFSLPENINFYGCSFNLGDGYISARNEYAGE